MDKTGQTLDFPLSEQHDEHAAQRFFTKATRRHSVLEKITNDGSDAIAMRSTNVEHGTAGVIREMTSLNRLADVVHPRPPQLPSKNRRGFSTMSWWMSCSEAPNALSRGSTRREINV